MITVNYVEISLGLEIIQGCVCVILSAFTTQLRFITEVRSSTHAPEPMYTERNTVIKIIITLEKITM